MFITTMKKCNWFRKNRFSSKISENTREKSFECMWTLPKKFWWSYDENWKVQFQKIGSSPNSKKFHTVLKTLSEISNVLLKFSIWNVFKFFLFIIRHPYTFLKYFKNIWYYLLITDIILTCQKDIVENHLKTLVSVKNQN